MSYWDEHGFLHAQNGVHNSENAILFTYMWAELENEDVPTEVRNDFYMYADPECDHTKYKLSLDNVNACCCFFPLPFLRELVTRVPWYVYARPDNFYTWSVCAKKHWLLRKLALPFASLMMIYSCYKFYDKKPRGEGKDRVYIQQLATSGKLQVWTRLKAVRMPITQKICNYLIESDWGAWKQVFRTYFETGHPINSYPREAYDL